MERIADLTDNAEAPAPECEAPGCGGCGGGCRFCCGLASMVASGTVLGLVVQDPGHTDDDWRSRSWSWERLRQLVVSPAEAGFHVVQLAIGEDGEVPAAEGSFDMAVLPVTSFSVPVPERIVEGAVRSVREGGPLLAVCSIQAACAAGATQEDNWIAAFRAHGRECERIVVSRQPTPADSASECSPDEPADLIALLAYSPEATG